MKMQLSEKLSSILLFWWAVWGTLPKHKPTLLKKSRDGHQQFWECRVIIFEPNKIFLQLEFTAQALVLLSFNCGILDWTTNFLFPDFSAMPILWPSFMFVITIYTKFCNEISKFTAWSCKKSNFYTTKGYATHVLFIYWKNDSLNWRELFKYDYCNHQMVETFL